MPASVAARMALAIRPGPSGSRWGQPADQVDAGLQRLGQGGPVAGPVGADHGAGGQGHGLDVEQPVEASRRLLHGAQGGGPDRGGHVDVGPHRGDPVDQQQLHGRRRPLDDAVVGDATLAGGGDPGVDRSHQVAGRVGHEVGGQGLVEVGVGVGQGRQQQPAPELVDGGAARVVARPLTGSPGRVDRGDDPVVADGHVDRPAVWQAGVGQDRRHAAGSSRPVRSGEVPALATTGPANHRSTSRSTKAARAGSSRSAASSWAARGWAPGRPRRSALPSHQPAIMSARASGWKTRPTRRAEAEGLDGEAGTGRQQLGPVGEPLGGLVVALEHVVEVGEQLGAGRGRLDRVEAVLGQAVGPGPAPHAGRRGQQGGLRGRCPGRAARRPAPRRRRRAPEP